MVLLVAAILLSIALVPAPARAAQAWERMRDMPVSRAEFGVAALNGKVYAAGGFVDDGSTHLVLDEVDVYDPATDAWTQAAPLPVPLRGLVLVAAAGKLVAAGGTTNGTSPSDPTNATWVYDPAQDRWTAGSPMPEARIWASGVAIGGSVEVWGGTTPFPGMSTNTRFSYAVGPDRWTVLQPMPMTLTNFGVAETATAVYVTGGWRNYPNTMALTLSNGSWAERSPMLKGRGAHASAALGGLVYAIAGVTADTTEYAPSRVVEVYAPDNDTWTRGPDYPEPSHSLGAVTVGSALYAMGGTNNSLTLRSVYSLAGPTTPVTPPNTPAETPWLLIGAGIAVAVALVLGIAAVVRRRSRRRAPPPPP